MINILKKYFCKAFSKPYVIINILLSIIFVTSCNRTAPKKFYIWTNLRPVERKIIQEKLDQFGKLYPEYRFVLLFYQTEELRTNYIISALAGKGPELILGPSDNIGPLSDIGVIRPMEDLFQPSFLDSFIHDPFPANTWFRGHLYQVADRIGNHLTLVYNKDLLPDPPRSISELITMGKGLTKDLTGNGIPDTYALAWNYTEPYFVIPFIGGYGGWVLDSLNNPTLNTEAVVKAAKLIYNLANKYKIIPKECDYETANALFLDKKVAMIINGPWSWGTYIKAGINLGLARIPRINETDLWPTPMVSPIGYSMNINLKGKKLKLAVKLIKVLTSDAFELNLAKRFILIPSRKNALKDSVLHRNKLWQESYDQLSVGRLMPVVTQMRWIWDAMRPAYQGIFTGQYTAEDAAVEMQKLAEKLISENR